MIIGEVTDEGDTFVHLAVQGPTGALRNTKAVLDTGFNGPLALPARMISTLDLHEHSDIAVMLANGDMYRVPTYKGATVSMGGKTLSPIVVEAAEPLVGTRLLWGSALRIECWQNGNVEVLAP